MVQGLGGAGAAPASIPPELAAWETGFLAYASDRDGDFEIFVKDLSSGLTTKLTNNEVDDYSPDWSPDGSWIAYERESQRLYSALVYKVSADGSERKRLQSTGPYGGDPAWAPDGELIAYSASAWDGEEVTIEVMTPNGTHVERPYPPEYGYWFRNPTWSRDGKRFALVEDSSLSTSRSCCGVDYAETTVIVEGYDGYSDHPMEVSEVGSPAWSPSGDTIAFSGERVRCADWRKVETCKWRDDRDLYVVAPDGSGLTRLNPDRSDTAPWSWSEDGQTIFYYSNVNGSYDLFAVQRDGTSQVQLTTGKKNEVQPDYWSAP
jgi:TolB protein